MPPLTAPPAPEELHETLTWSGGTWDEVGAPGARFVDCELASLVVAGGDLARATWRAGSLRGVRFVGTGLARSQWRGTALDAVAWSGCEWLGGRLTDLRVTGAVLDTVNLRGAVLDGVVFEDCVLRDVDLGGARLTGVRFPGCRIERLDLTKATLARVDLRGASVDLARGWDRLAGAVVDGGQLVELAPALAAHLGLEVRAPGDP